MSHAAFFLLLAGIACVAAGLLLALDRPARRIFAARGEAPGALAQEPAAPAAQVVR